MAMTLNLVDFVANAPLYSHISVSSDADIRILSSWLVNNQKFDCFCFHCNNRSIFDFDYPFFIEGRNIAEKHSEATREISGIATRITHFVCTCGRNERHKIFIYLVLGNKAMIKIGQLPSIADIAFGEISRFRKTVDSAQMAELKRAIGLASHGVGIGSFVYLRRVFEALLNTHKLSSANEGVQFPEWDSARISERIAMPKDSLPTFLTDNKSIYGILSKGIHELDENSCLQYFPILREAIFMILEHDEANRMRIEKEKELSSMISKISSEMR